MQRLYRNQLLSEIADKMPHERPDWPTIADILMETPRFRGDNVGPIEKGNLVGTVGEIWVRGIFMSLQDDYSDRLELDIIDDNSWAGDVHFLYRRDQLYARLKGQDKAEFDLVASVDRMPVIVEVGLGTKAGIRKKVNPRKLNERIDYVSRLFGTNEIGYMVVVAQDGVSPPHQKGYLGSYQNRFLERGGIIVSLPTKRKKFKRRVTRFAENNDIEIAA